LNAISKHINRIHDQPKVFDAVMRAFRKKTESDRWEDWLLLELAVEVGLEEVPDYLLDLCKQPKDGR